MVGQAAALQNYFSLHPLFSRWLIFKSKIMKKFEWCVSTHPTFYIIGYNNINELSTLATPESEKILDIFGPD
jgi:hypothetical protein